MSAPELTQYLLAVIGAMVGAFWIDFRNDSRRTRDRLHDLESAMIGITTYIVLADPRMRSVLHKFAPPLPIVKDDA